jgi:ribosomal protein L22
MAATETRPEVRAVAKWVRTSPRKARLVVEHISGRSVPEARTILAFTPRAAAREVEKVLRSAVANAEANHGLVGDDLFVSSAYVDDGVTMKRWRAQARGRAARIRKRTCHITVKLSAAEESSDFAHRGRRTPGRRRRRVLEPEAPVTAAAEVQEEADERDESAAEEATSARRRRDEAPVEPEAGGDAEAAPQAETEPEAEGKES